MKKIYCIYLIKIALAFALQYCVVCIVGRAQQSVPPTVSYCDLVRSPEQYDGKEVNIFATYRYGFEWQEVFCLDCRNVAKTWLEIDDDMPSDSIKALRKAPKDAGIINAVFTGVFRSSGGPFGDGGYRFQFTAKRISKIEVVYKDGRVPEMLPPDARKKVCGGVSKDGLAKKSNSCQ
jgi:hypothetical protein